MKRYMVKEIFYSIQGEGVRAGTAAIFVRFAGCNLDCNEDTTGWTCDTDFSGGTSYPLGELLDAVRIIQPSGWVILTGGEPALQIDQPLVDVFHAAGYRLAVETNGTKELPKGLDWICCSPKYEHVVLYGFDECKYVLASGQEPGRSYGAKNLLVSPAFKGDEPDPDAIAWCVQLVLDNPGWRLSLQTHKFMGVR